jgi:hypothetical protein
MGVNMREKLCFLVECKLECGCQLICFTVRPISLVRTHQVPQVLVQESIHTLLFPTVWKWKAILNLSFFPDLPREMHSKCTCEFRISIRHNHSRQPVVPPPTFENWLCGLRRGCGFHNRHHVCQLDKPHYHHQDGIISL